MARAFAKDCYKTEPCALVRGTLGVSIEPNPRFATTAETEERRGCFSMCTLLLGRHGPEDEMKSTGGKIWGFAGNGNRLCGVVLSVVVFVPFDGGL